MSFGNVLNVKIYERITEFIWTVLYKVQVDVVFQLLQRMVTWPKYNKLNRITFPRDLSNLSLQFRYSFTSIYNRYKLNGLHGFSTFADGV